MEIKNFQNLINALPVDCHSFTIKKANWNFNSRNHLIESVFLNKTEVTISKWIKPHMPKFWYFDDYYHLPGNINIQRLQNSSLEDEKLKTAKALFDLARIRPEEILKTTDYERFCCFVRSFIK